MSHLIHKEITGKIIKAYYNVYNGLTRGYAEVIYENAMMVELQQQNIKAHRQPEYDIYYKEWIVGKQRLDIFAAQKIVIELKVKESLDNLDQAQLMSYLKTTGCQVGLLFNFGSLKPEFKRVYFTPKSSQPPPLPPSRQWPNLLFADLSYQVIGSAFQVHQALGPGYIYRVYANACYRELQARGMSVNQLSQMTIYYRDKDVGSINFSHYQVENKIMFFPIAIRNEQKLVLKNFRHWMTAQQIRLGIMANFYVPQLQLSFMRNNENGG